MNTFTIALKRIRKLGVLGFFGACAKNMMAPSPLTSPVKIERPAAAFGIKVTHSVRARKNIIWPGYTVEALRHVTFGGAQTPTTLGSMASGVKARLLARRYEQKMGASPAA